MFCYGHQGGVRHLDQHRAGPLAGQQEKKVVSKAGLAQQFVAQVMAADFDAVEFSLGNGRLKALCCLRHMCFLVGMDAGAAGAPHIKCLISVIIFALDEINFDR